MLGTLFPLESVSDLTNYGVPLKMPPEFTLFYLPFKGCIVSRTLTIVISFSCSSGSCMRMSEGLTVKVLERRGWLVSGEILEEEGSIWDLKEATCLSSFVSTIMLCLKLTSCELGSDDMSSSIRLGLKNYSSSTLVSITLRNSS